MKEWKRISFLFMIYVISLFMLGCLDKSDDTPDINSEKSEEGDAKEISKLTRQQQSNTVIEQRRLAIKDSDYTLYSGVWTSNGDISNDIYKKTGGAILELTISGKSMTASYTCVESKFNKIVTVDNIKAEIVEGEAHYTFEDDGWGNSGKLDIFFDDNAIRVEVKDLVIEKYNTTGMCVTDGILYEEGVKAEIK